MAACGATTGTADGRSLACDMDEGHWGPVHGDSGEEWGDYELIERDLDRIAAGEVRPAPAPAPDPDPDPDE
ncbi:hypothetical protein [Parafrankia discariae]|uniref:hypothetical protein n=1 Tax=Parafrankia discariae TaxID=365528 RepID=UPI00039F6864|nr:hypothetical protein [Parafrankia discariae]